MKKSLLYASIVVAVTTLSGCGPKDEGYKTVDRSADEMKVSDIDSLSSQPFLYRRMMGETPRYLTAVRGKLPDNVKLVKVKRTENGISIYQVDADNVGAGHDGRFNTENNLKPVLTIGGKYIDYKCSEDSYDKCTNKEEVDSSAAKTWKDKQYFVPDFNKVTIAEQDMNQLFGLSCAVDSEQTVLVQDPEHHWSGQDVDLKNGVINFEIKHTYSVPNASCLPKFAPDWDVDKLSFTTTEYFSIVARDKLASKNYEAVPYEETDGFQYGFFKLNSEFRDENYDTGKEGQFHTYLERFNPNKTAIDYYLSNSFWEKKNDVFLAAAKEAEAIINMQNKRYQTGLPHINFVQANDIRYGDLRHSFLRLFDQPLDNGLLGVANMSADPLTGEIVSGGFNQFSGNFLGNAAYDYNRLVRDFNQGRLNPDSVTKLIHTPYPLNGKVTANHNLVTNETPLINDNYNNIDAMKAEADQQQTISPSDEGYSFIKQKEHSSSARLNLTDVNSALTAQVSTQDGLTAQQAKLQDVKNERVKLQYMSENNMLSKDAYLGARHRSLPVGVKGFYIDWTNSELWKDGIVGGQLKKLSNLPKTLRTDMVRKTAAVGFVGTIIHEFGHSIGLRHNFAASRDYKHLFSKIEIQKQKDELRDDYGYKGVSLETDNTSQMEYAIDMFGMGFGPYDMAAIRFGYKREIQDNKANLDDWNNEANWHSLKPFDKKRLNEWKDGNTVGSTKNGPTALLEEQLNNDNSLSLNQPSSENGFSPFVGFEYCTDSNLSLNSNCNQFDQGFNLDQIAQHYAERYLNAYEVRNTRFERQSYNEYTIPRYAFARVTEFDSMHQFMEDTAGLTERLNWGDFYIDEGCSQSPDMWFCDRANAKNRMVKLFMQVATQPDALIKYNFKDSNDKPVFSNDLVTSLSYWLDNYDKAEPYIAAVDKLKEGQVVTKYSDAPKVFDNLAVYAGIKPDYQDEYAKYTPVVEVVGRALNSGQAAVSNPQHPYSNDKDFLGVWPDKLAAMQELVTHHTQRDTSSIGYEAMIDYAPINHIFRAMLCRMVFGVNDDGEMTCDQQAGVDRDNLDWNGITKIDDIYPFVGNDAYYNNMVNQDIEALPSGATHIAKWFGFDLDQNIVKGKTNLLKMMLRQVALYSTDSDTYGEDRARIVREFVGIHTADQPVDVTDSVTLKGKKLVATEDNVLALALLADLNTQKAKLPGLKNQLTGLKTKSAKFNTLTTKLTNIQDLINSDLKALAQLPVLDENDYLKGSTLFRH